MKLFVYGSLRKGECNHYILKGQKFLGAVKTSPLYTMVSFGLYPGLGFAGSGTTSIVGEVYEVTEAVAKRIEKIELGAGYLAEEIQLEDGSLVLGYTTDRYHLGGCPVVASGDWCAREDSTTNKLEKRRETLSDAVVKVMEIKNIMMAYGLHQGYADLLQDQLLVERGGKP